MPFLNNASGLVSGLAFINGRGMTLLLDNTCLDIVKKAHYSQNSIHLIKFILLQKIMHSQLLAQETGNKCCLGHATGYFKSCDIKFCDWTMESIFHCGEHKGPTLLFSTVEDSVLVWLKMLK